MQLPDGMRGLLVAELDRSIAGFTEATDGATIAAAIVRAIEAAAEGSGVEPGIIGRIEASGTSVQGLLSERLVGEERSDLTGDDIVGFLESAFELQFGAPREAAV